VEKKKWGSRYLAGLIRNTPVPQHSNAPIIRKEKRTMRSYFMALGILSILVGCTSIPEGLQPVSGFEVNRYLGRWYEIARLDHSFERNLSNVIAEYSVRDGGGIDVLNKGFDKSKGEWREIKGVARFIGEKNVGSLKVSFFGPFWGGYHVIALDKENYRYSMVAAPSRSYLWILSRDKMLDQEIVAELVARARQWDFDTEKLIYVEHEKEGGNR
jgi:apolipoprotein D and lipocalin family protein